MGEFSFFFGNQKSEDSSQKAQNILICKVQTTFYWNWVELGCEGWILPEVSHDNSEKIKYSDGMSTRQLQQAREIKWVVAAIVSHAASNCAKFLLNVH